MNSKIKVLLLDGYTLQAYSVSKSLKKAGFNVSILTPTKMSYGYFSRFPDKKIICPDIKQETLYKTFLLQFLQKYHFDVVLPLFDDSADFLSRHYDEISHYAKVATMPWTVFVNAANKGKLMELCRQYGIPHPRTYPLHAEDIEEAIAYVGFPSLIKPNHSAGARGIVRVETEEELRLKVTDALAEYEGVTLQEYVNHSGKYYNVMLYRNCKGDFEAYTIIEIQRYFPLKGGTSSYSITVENAKLLDISMRTLDILNWVGFADFDFIQDKDTLEYKLIEINPRIPASIHAAYISGVNFPEIIVKDLLGFSVPKMNYHTGMKLRYFALDVMWFLFCKDRLKLHPSWFCFWEKNMRYQDGELSDPLTMICGLLSGVVKYLNPSFRKSKLSK